MSANELGAYLRSRREAIGPAEVGLPVGTRRRVPGLRREELATLADLSVDYLTRLEQGRDRHPSADILAGLADALRLSTEERKHLVILAKLSSGAGRVMCAPPDKTDGAVRPTVRQLLYSLEPTPAVVLNGVGDILLFTPGYADLVETIGILDPDVPNLVRFLFTDTRAKKIYHNWAAAADECVAHLKIESYADPDGTAWFIDELRLTGGPDFSERISGPPSAPHLTGTERWDHPEAGTLELNYETFDIPASGNLRLLAYLPADEATAAALDRISGRHPGPLLVVSG